VYPDNEYKTELLQSGQASCSFHGTSSGPQIQGGPDIADGKWHYIECIENGTGLTLYVDGTQVAQQTVSIGTVNTSSSDATIGSHGTFDWYKGKLDDVTITFS
jgi:Concanavalin A-like lectin/glucanases superfamily